MSGEERARDERLDERDPQTQRGEERARDERLDERDPQTQRGQERGHGTKRARVRGAFQWPVVLLLATIWVLMWGELSVLHVTSGVLVAFIVLAAFPQPPIEHIARVRPLGFVRLAARFAYDLVTASAQVAAEALRFGHYPKNAVIEVHLHSRSDLLLTLTAELVSLVPGSLLIETSHTRSVLFLHIFGVEDLDDVEEARAAALAQERRVVEAFATPHDYETYWANVRKDRAT